MTTNAASLIEISLKLQRNFQVPGSDELNVVIWNVFGYFQTKQLAHNYYEKAKTKPDFTSKKLPLNFSLGT